jgi:hypothetical protein
MSEALEVQMKGLESRSLMNDRQVDGQFEARALVVTVRNATFQGRPVVRRESRRRLLWVGSASS